jgi:formylglycine-generating enzyme
MSSARRKSVGCAAGTRPAMTRPRQIAIIRRVFEIVAILLIVAAVAIVKWQLRGSAQPNAAQQTTEAGCERGISQARLVRSETTDASRQRPNASPPRSSSQEGMRWIPAGEFWMGSSERGFEDARPWHKVYLDGFWMDTTDVTNDAYARFVAATNYTTVAERKPRMEDYPGAPAQNLVPGSVVFSPPRRDVPLNDHFQWWSFVKGANWRHPEGPASDLKGREKHPVVHIAYEDALAYCKWSGKRLPTEAEFEYAERGGLDRKRYAWGDDFRPGGRFMANTFQGHFPNNNTAEDGFLSTAPVASFPPNGYGLYDMAGNVWEYTSDWHRPDYYRQLSDAGVARNPKGPPNSFDSSEPGVAKKVQRGGSFLCTDQYCSRYVPGGRGKGALDTGTNHLGFRCVGDAVVQRTELNTK